MFKLSFKIWWKGVIAFFLLCAALAVPTLGLALVGFVFGLIISLTAIPFYAIIIYILKRSEANSSNAVFLLFVTTVPAVLIALFSIAAISHSMELKFHLNKFYINPAFYMPWICAVIGIRFSRKHIHQFFAENNN